MFKEIIFVYLVVSQGDIKVFNTLKLAEDELDKLEGEGVEAAIVPKMVFTESIINKLKGI
jgi:hypothetical protein